MLFSGVSSSDEHGNILIAVICSVLGGILLASLVTAAVFIYIRRSRDRGSIRNIETRDETATDMLQTNEGEDNEYDYMFDRTDNWNYFIMVGSLSITQLAKSGEIVETLGSTQVMQEKFPVAGL